LKAKLFTQDGSENGTIDLPDQLFTTKICPNLVHLALVRQQANARIPSAHTLRRSEVKGTTKKMFRQKGTGNARKGAKTSPIHRGGGVAWGPRNNRNFTKKMPKKMRRAAMTSVLSEKAKTDKIIALEKFELTAPKTKEFEKIAQKLPKSRNLLVIHNRNDILARSVRNLKFIKPLFVGLLNIHDLTKYDQILFEKSALEEAEKIYK
jgi:large subunit ribosomal protein L4